MCNVEKLIESCARKISRAIHDASPNQQLIIGLAPGWIVGAALIRLEKSTALFLGVGIILLHLAKENQLVQIDLNDIDMVKYTSFIEYPPTWTVKVKEFAKCNVAFTYGFISGVLIGLASY
ncbi:unnamed protein product [Phyllotreta striolata]|uniref:FUN14 family protein n=1 Tax=Phyllotreta striolata TaxID=444603 RepID=A0A9N9TSG5_PHYSR|nr:unnamed protein product [Phyllotreta striolata]